jgi:hypothetical protein
MQSASLVTAAVPMCAAVGEDFTGMGFDAHLKRDKQTLARLREVVVSIRPSVVLRSVKTYFHSYSAERERPQDCRQGDFCDPAADCILNPQSNSYDCRCRQGYFGDGRRCNREQVSPAGGVQGMPLSKHT